MVLLTFASFEPRIPPHPHFPPTPPSNSLPLRRRISSVTCHWVYGVSEATRLFMFQTLERKKSKIIVSLCALVRSSEGGLKAPCAGKKDPFFKIVPSWVKVTFLPSILTLRLVLWRCYKGAAASEFFLCLPTRRGIFCSLTAVYSRP